MAREDAVVVYHDTFRDQWRWRRTNPDGGLIAVGAVGYTESRDCERAALRINARPFIFTLDAQQQSHIDTSGRLTARRRPA